MKLKRVDKVFDVRDLKRRRYDTARGGGKVDESSGHE